MNAHTHAYQDYASSSSVKSTKDTEIEIIFETTRRLKVANQNRKEDYASFATAVHTNRKLWITLASDVASSENALPPDLRARIFFLGEFVQEYSSKVLQNDLGISPLLDINLTILRGLGNKRHET
ncbi:flagellar biosynthesis regulator FlaF [Marivita sp.]|uniref:flagellar biosynthesis regulator FlaF n=1 Tax=Marivita sp. TaxID=2003365 RepID=UPI003F72F041